MIKSIEPCLDKDTYKFVVAEAIVKHVVSEMKEKNETMNKQKVVNKTYQSLRALKIE